jgi:hypothetical protein
VRTSPEFESLKTRVYSCSSKEKDELLAMLQAVSATGRSKDRDPNLQNIPMRTEEGRRIREAFVKDNTSRPDSELFDLIKDVKQAKTNIPVSVSFKHLKPEERGRLQKVATYFEEALALHFPNIKMKQVRFGLKRFIISVAINKCVDDDAQPTMGRILDCLMPLEELLENQFPGYMERGILEDVIHQQLMRGKVSVRNQPTS